MRPSMLRKLPRARVRDWTSWSRGFQARFEREVTTHLALQWHAQRTRRFNSVQQRWLHSTLVLHPHLSWSTELRTVANTFQKLTQSYNYPLVPLSPVSAPRPAPRAPLPTRVLRSTVVVPRTERHTFTKHRQTTRQEFITTLEKRFTERTKSPGSRSERIVERTWRARPAQLPETRMTLRRGLAPVAALVPAAPQPRILHSPRSLPTVESHTSPMPPALNLDHLVDQVLQRIDRRIVARRERLGRI